MITHFTYYKSVDRVSLRVSTAKEMMLMVKNIPNIEYSTGFWRFSNANYKISVFKEEGFWPELVKHFEAWVDQLEMWHGEEEEAEAEDQRRDVYRPDIDHATMQ
jgi:hypothetical protein